MADAEITAGEITPNEEADMPSTSQSKRSKGGLLDGWVDEVSESIPCYTPGYSVWRQLILNLSKEAHQDSKPHWRFVHKAFTAMRNNLHVYWPDPKLLKVGLEAAVITKDAELSVDLIVRARHFPFTQNGAPSWLHDHSACAKEHEEQSDLFSWNDRGWDEREPALRKPGVSEAHRIPLQAFVTAMRVCISTGAMSSAERLLDCFRDSSDATPHSLKRELFALAMKGYAKKGDGDAAQNLLKEMQDGGLCPT